MAQIATRRRSVACGYLLSDDVIRRDQTTPAKLTATEFTVAKFIAICGHTLAAPISSLVATPDLP